MATLRNKRKLVAVSRETPEGSRSSRGQTVLDPELTQDYISQVFEEIEGRVTKKLSKEFSKTESRILGALSKLNEFLLNPQVRTCSVAVQGTSGNANSENREPHGDRSSNDPYPEVGYFAHPSGQLISPEAETNSHMVTETYPHSFFSNLSNFLLFVFVHKVCVFPHNFLDLCPSVLFMAFVESVDCSTLQQFFEFSHFWLFSCFQVVFESWAYRWFLFNYCFVNSVAGTFLELKWILELRSNDVRAVDWKLQNYNN